jgi:hypothetical protein
MKRTLVYPEALGAAATDIGEGKARGDEFLEGAKWVLERDAEAGTRVCLDPPIYVLSLQAGPRRAGLFVFYTIAYDQVLVLSLAEGNAQIRAIGPEGRGY